LGTDGDGTATVGKPTRYAVRGMHMLRHAMRALHAIPTPPEIPNPKF
jgi:hypothetical protein